MTLLVAILCAICAFCASADERSAQISEFTNHVFAAITGGVLDRYSLTVDFATTAEPPYLVGIFDSLDAQFPPSPQTRCRPIGYKVVDGRRATLACDTRRLPYTLFVQVLPAAWTNEPGFRLISPAEVAERHALSQAEAAEVFGTVLPRTEYEPCYPPASLYPGCSQEVPLSRPFRSLSVRDGWRIGLDWLGRPRRIEATTNAVPGRIYWEGVR